MFNGNFLDSYLSSVYRFLECISPSLKFTPIFCKVAQKMYPPFQQLTFRGLQFYFATAFELYIEILRLLETILKICAHDT